MGRFSALVLLAVLSVFFNEVEATYSVLSRTVKVFLPCLQNYERLRIGGLVFTCLLVAGGISVLLWNKCKGTKKTDEEAGQI
ncbi:FXYD domain-containing ion transport regulator 11 [Paramormyrops kingsleyae]|uniref:FXYD domain-containing ion transport regulator 11 n=1 Tax=Paramormyrops kingsleyae TaxID=1676925 RepID=UPI003B96CA3B